MKCDAVYTGKTSFSISRVLSRLFRKQFTNNGYQVVLADYKTLQQINLIGLDRNALLMIWSQVDEYFSTLDFLKTEKFLLLEVFCWFRGKQTMYLFFGLRGKLNLNMDLFQHHVAVTRLPFVIGAPDPFRKTINVLTEKLKKVDLLSDRIISLWDTRKTLDPNNLFLAGS